MRLNILLSVVLILGFSQVAAENSEITAVKLENSKYNSSAKLKITSAKVLKKDSPILLLVSNFPIGVDTNSPQIKELGVPMNSSGSRVLILFSNGKRIYVTKDDVNLLLTERSYFDKRFRVTIPQEIYKEIVDTNFEMYSMLINSYGETIKSDGAFYTDVYCYLNEKQGIQDHKADLKRPFIVYNEPFGQKVQGNILLDFIVRNATVSPNEYKVDLYIDGVKIQRLYSQTPYVLQNLSKGKHECRLELVDASGVVIKNSISINSATIYVK